ncbi:hypothetical protein HYS95_00290 [Candidatus Daviesbacteria bacterium]|nr:hypothetical protein [Candidatus Daviesbacteria bacterium]
MNVEQIKIIVDVRRYSDPRKPWVMDVTIGDTSKQVPVYHCREDSHQEEIAKEFANGKACVAFGVGLYGVAGMVADPRTKRNSEGAEIFFRAKTNRDPHAKVPIFITPRDMHQVIDFDAMHPKFAKLFSNREWRENLWRNGVSFHIVFPVPKDAHYIHPVLITTPEDLKHANKPEEQMVSVNTVSAFWWHDPDWQRIAYRAASYNPFGFAGISSFNEHKQAPAWIFNDLSTFIHQTGKCPFDMVVRDEIGEPVSVRSSHPQYRVPLKGEQAEWIVIRHGSISIDRWLKAVGSPFPARRLATATVAARATSSEKDLSELVFTVRDKTIEDYCRRHPKSAYNR